MTADRIEQLKRDFIICRAATEVLCEGLEPEDFVVQPVDFVSPLKWHLGHTTWFFETFVLRDFAPNFLAYHPDFSFLFNSYYESEGDRVERPLRGNMTRPTVAEILEYRKDVTSRVQKLCDEHGPDSALWTVLELGINHEQQHQELFVYDLKYILGHQLSKPQWEGAPKMPQVVSKEVSKAISSGLYEIGHQGDGFCFDNELGRHQVFLENYRINVGLVTNGEYLDFIEDGGYRRFEFWHAEGWDWIRKKDIKLPLYWRHDDNGFLTYDFWGMKPLDRNAPIQHISFYEASAYAEWKGMRLPTEFEWEVASEHLNWGRLWEWTESAYLPYPGFAKSAGALGEYNGKFMINQKVLRGASIATPDNHRRYTYRNFYHPTMRWQYCGFRLVE